MSKTALIPALDAYVKALKPEIEGLPAERRQVLDRVAAYIAEKRAADEPAELLFICTHNSRRSQMGQVWAATAASYFGVVPVHVRSGGTEATAFDRRAVAALRRAGFAVEVEGPGGDNPHYRVAFSDEAEPQECFSKVFTDAPRTSRGVAAVMTCSQADEACPLVPGAELRVALPYDDPKAADGTPQEAIHYDERCRQIATEMLYLFSKVAA